MDNPTAVTKVTVGKLAETLLKVNGAGLQNSLKKASGSSARPGWIAGMHSEILGAPRTIPVAVIAKAQVSTSTAYCSEILPSTSIFMEH